MIWSRLEAKSGWAEILELLFLTGIFLARTLLTENGRGTFNPYAAGG